MISLPHTRRDAPGRAGSQGGVDALPARASARRSLAAALGLVFVLAPTSALASRPHGTAKARGAIAAAPAPRGAPAGALPPAVAAILRGSGLPAKSFAFDVRRVDGAESMIVTDPDAAKETPALDSLVEWVAKAG